MTAVLVLLGLAVVGSLLWAGYARSQQRQARLGLELQRIQSKQQNAMNDIRRRRQYAEEQLRRLSRWSQ